MNLNTWAKFCLFFIIITQLIDIQAQNFSKNIVFHWNSPLIYQQNDDDILQLLHFDGAIAFPDDETLPCSFEKWAANAFYDSFDVELSNEQYVRMSNDEAELVSDNYQETSPKVTVRTLMDKKKHFVSCWLVPIRKTSNGYEKLLSVTVTVKGVAKKEDASVRAYAANSVLQSGTWYKVSVQKDGVYKVTYDDLAAMGVPVASLRHANISVFGHGGGMLPESNAVFRNDDLQELNLEMHAGSDEYFGSGDYFLFYAEGPHSWSFDAQEQRFSHRFNLYDDKAFYFINVDAGIGTGKRIQTAESAESHTQTVNSYTAYGFYEVDSRNIIGAGRCWYGDRFDGTTSFSYPLSIPSSVNGAGRLTVAVAATSLRYSTFNVRVNGQRIGSVGVSALLGKDDAETSAQDLALPASGGNVSVTLDYSKPTSSSVGYLDYIEWQAPCALRMEGSQMPFCAPQAVGTISQYQIANASSSLKVWDVTELVSTSLMPTQLSGTTLSYETDNAQLKKFVAFIDAGAYSTHFEGTVTNQNLHGTSAVDMVIVTYPDFKSQADRLANFHQEQGLSVKVVTPQQVYNEFSGAAQDVTAIRDYMKMIYDKTGGVQPKYLLLMGRPSYDYRGIEGNCKLYVPNYQLFSEINENSLRANDDYFALLDENEGANCVGLLDLAVGRFPVTTSAQAKIAVDKTIAYASSDILGEGTQTASYGDWKNVVAIAADDEDGHEHIGTADDMAQLAETTNPNINLDKIYLDSYRQVTYSSSARYPDATTAINNRMNRGCLLFNYVGHGGKYGWAAERVIELTDIQGWSNKYNQPWMITLTCEFGWYDRALTAPAEMVFLNENGGASGMITTSRVAFTASNHEYGMNLYRYLLRKDNGLSPCIGDVNRLSKNASGGAGNSLGMLYVMGDPAIRLALPNYNIVTDSINGVAVAEFADTLRALSRVRVSAHIEDDNGNLISDFSGSAHPSVYDKKQTNHTLQNDPDSHYFEFEVQKSVLFKGNVTVTNGRFDFSFILPKDINYAYGKGKMSYYANSRSADASGAYSEVVVGGMSDNEIVDANGPEIQVFMNDEKFVNGGTVNESPTLLVKLKDEYGINTTGNGIGHDLVAILDDGEQVVLNNYYEAERDSFNCGTVRYPYDHLSLGTHKLKIRAWDILNNVSESELEFTVVSDEGLVLDHVLNYPNPFTTNTAFYFEHNCPGATLDVLVTIYTISGKVVRTLQSTQCAQGNRSEPIQWDGRDDYGDKIGRGTYLYRLKVRTSDGQQAEKFEKIVIL